MPTQQLPLSRIDTYMHYYYKCVSFTFVLTEMLWLCTSAAWISSSKACSELRFSMPLSSANDRKRVRASLASAKVIFSTTLLSTMPCFRTSAYVKEKEQERKHMGSRGLLGYTSTSLTYSKFKTPNLHSQDHF